MSENDRRVAAALLRVAGEHFGNHGCNDFELDAVLPDAEDRRALMRRLHQWNGDPEEFDPDGSYEIEADFALMEFLADVLDPDSEAA